MLALQQVLGVAHAIARQFGQLDHGVGGDAGEVAPDELGEGGRSVSSRTRSRLR